MSVNWGLEGTIRVDLGWGDGCVMVRGVRIRGQEEEYQ